MSRVCNKAPNLPDGSVAEQSLYERVDGPIATGSAHFMRAGSELHLMHSDLELNDVRQAALRVRCAAAAIRAGLVEYRSSHRVAHELGFYPVHDERLRAAGGGTAPVRETLTTARDADLVQLDKAAVEAIALRYEEGGDEAAFGHFVTALTAFSADLDGFAAHAADARPADWQRVAWQLLTAFDRIRIYGQALAVINILGMTPSAVAVVGAGQGRRNGI
ncbi:hypothetical protein [Streptomyces sp. MZ04]|uniref:hypothetical protein n=1 Tax=Streptomyces sp. MZ04 TaxID=2559236 RepID=UPI00107ECC04|nr:hypothetical protein [Streptomyces sp. MZ04]TGB07297.1 hypothetical protein E2651_22030 [Streptomyces sp. MZ04]